MPFTTWTALYNDMLDALADGEHLVRQFSRGDKQISFKSSEDFFRYFNFVEQRAKQESGAYKHRIYGRI
jgi:hypothetical protein